MSHWGQDFRKDYLHLDFLKDKYPRVPLLCLTATATIKVKDDITKRLKIDKDYAFFQSSFNRANGTGTSSATSAVNRMPAATS